jgi:hypothetical protein
MDSAYRCCNTDRASTRALTRNIIDGHHTCPLSMSSRSPSPLRGPTQCAAPTPRIDLATGRYTGRASTPPSNWSSCGLHEHVASPPTHTGLAQEGATLVTPVPLHPTGHHVCSTSTSPHLLHTLAWHKRALLPPPPPPPPFMQNLSNWSAP